MTVRGPPAITEYRLEVDLDLEGARWSGVVECDIAQGVRTLELDADGLEIRSVTRNGRALGFRARPAEARLEVDLDSDGPATVRIGFEGRVADRALVGLYRCPSGAGQVLTTHCEPVGARHIFPCLDRPDRKARIRLTVRTSPSIEVVSNMPPDEVRATDGAREWRFPATPPMATYLFYLAAGTFDRFELGGDRLPVRVLTPPGRGEAGRFAAESAAAILAEYEEYYRIPYPLPKLDLIAVSELAFGAMENWGAIAFDDPRLLVDGSSASFARRDVFETIAHEVAHQWFGNLVTMRWWNDIWLNESFATLLESRITERLRPEFEPIEEFVLRRWGMVGAFAADSLRSTHPVRGEVARPEEINQVFDEISYGKGASVLRMLEGYLGADRFRTGVTDYLNRFRYGNARTEDLWASLERASGQPVGRIVGPWTDRAGFPVVSAVLGDHGLELSQRQFLFRGSREAPPWPIPLQLEVDGKRSTLLFETQELTVPVLSAATVVLNPHALGFYRVRYDRTLFERLLAVLPGRPPLDRWVVLNDLAAFLVAGDVSWDDYARAVSVLGSSPDRLVIEEITQHLRDWALAFPGASAVQSFARRFLAEQFNRVGVARRPDERPDDGVLRESLTFARVQVDPGFARDLSELFTGWDRLDPDLRSAVAIARVRTEGALGHREALRGMENAATEMERLRFERALAWSGDPTLVAQTLDLVRDGTVRAGHAAAVVAHAARNPVGRPLVLPWLERNLPDLALTFRGSGYLPLLFESVLPFAGLGRAETTRNYFTEHPYPEGSRGLAKGLELLDLRERFGARLPP